MIYAVPVILDFVSPLNVSQRQKWYIQTEYFVDKDKYYYSFVCHMIAFISLALTTAVVIGLTLYAYGFHACAMFKITKWEIALTKCKIIGWYVISMYLQLSDGDDDG